MIPRGVGLQKWLVGRQLLHTFDIFHSILQSLKV
jgi:hypothetical protein